MKIDFLQEGVALQEAVGPRIHFDGHVGLNDFLATVADDGFAHHVDPRLRVEEAQIVLSRLLVSVPVFQRQAHVLLSPRDSDYLEFLELSDAVTYASSQNVGFVDGCNTGRDQLNALSGAVERVWKDSDALINDFKGKPSGYDGHFRIKTGNLRLPDFFDRYSSYILPRNRNIRDVVKIHSPKNLLLIG